MLIVDVCVCAALLHSCASELPSCVSATLHVSYSCQSRWCGSLAHAKSLQGAHLDMPLSACLLVCFCFDLICFLLQMARMFRVPLCSLPAVHVHEWMCRSHSMSSLLHSVGTFAHQVLCAPALHVRCAPSTMHFSSRAVGVASGTSQWHALDSVQNDVW